MTTTPLPNIRSRSTVALSDIMPSQAPGDTSLGFNTFAELYALFQSIEGSDAVTYSTLRAGLKNAIRDLMQQYWDPNIAAFAVVPSVVNYGSSSLTPQNGALGAGATCTLVYSMDDKNLVTLDVAVVIPAIGTATGYLTINLPVPIEPSYANVTGIETLLNDYTETPPANVGAAIAISNTQVRLYPAGTGAFENNSSLKFQASYLGQVVGTNGINLPRFHPTSGGGANSGQIIADTNTTTSQWQMSQLHDLVYGYWKWTKAPWAAKVVAQQWTAMKAMFGVSLSNGGPGSLVNSSDDGRVGNGRPCQREPDVGDPHKRHVGGNVRQSPLMGSTGHYCAPAR